MDRISAKLDALTIKVEDAVGAAESLNTQADLLRLDLKFERKHLKSKKDASWKSRLDDFIDFSGSAISDDITRADHGIAVMKHIHSALIDAQAQLAAMHNYVGELQVLQFVYIVNW